MLASLLRRAVIWPIPPRYSGQAAAIVVLTVAIVVLMQTHTVRGLIAGAATAAALVLGFGVFWRWRRSTECRTRS